MRCGGRTGNAAQVEDTTTTQSIKLSGSNQHRSLIKLADGKKRLLMNNRYRREGSSPLQQSLTAVSPK